MGRTKALFVVLLAIGGALFLIAFQSPWVVTAAPLTHQTKAEKTPVIRKISATSDRLEGGAQVVIKGKNFTSDTVVIIGDAVATDVRVIKGKKIKVTVPPQKAPGRRTLSVWTPNGIAQLPFQIVPKKLEELSDGEITTIAGGVEYVEDGKNAFDAYFTLPTHVTGDREGNLYISDTFHHRIRRIDKKTNLITTIVGNGRRGFDGDGGSALAASIAFPGNLVITWNHKLIFVDAGNARIRQVNLETGLITTIVGNGIRGFGGDDGLATNASLSLANPDFTAIGGIAVDPKENLYIADLNNNRIRRVDHTSGVVTTYAGIGRSSTSLGDGGPATQANLFYVLDVAIDLSDNVFILDTGHNRIRRVDSQTGIISTIGGTGQNGFAGDGMPALHAKISAGGIEIDSNGNIYISDQGNYRIRRIDAKTTIIQTIAGNGTPGSPLDTGDIPATETGLGILFGGGIFLSPADLFVVEGQWDRLRKVNLQTGIISTIAGGKLPDNGDNGPALTARLFFSDIITRVGLSKPGDIAIAGSGEFLVLAENARHRIRKIDLTTGVITTLAGTGERGYNGDGLQANQTLLTGPRDVIFDRNGNLLIADPGNNRIRKVDGQTGIVTTVAGNGADEINVDYDEEYDQYHFLDDNIPAVEASIAGPQGMAVDRDGNLFISHYGLFVRQVDAQTQIITTRLGCCRGIRPGLVGVATGRSGNLYLATDAGLFKLEPNSTELKKIFNRSSLVDLAVNEQEFLFIPIPGGSSIFKTNPAGNSNTLIAGGELGYSGDNGPATEAAFSAPSSVAIDGANNLYIIDSGNHAVRVIKNGAR